MLARLPGTSYINQTAGHTQSRDTSRILIDVSEFPQFTYPPFSPTLFIRLFQQVAFYCSNLYFFHRKSTWEWILYVQNQIHFFLKTQIGYDGHIYHILWGLFMNIGHDNLNTHLERPYKRHLLWSKCSMMGAWWCTLNMFWNSHQWRLPDETEM